MAASSGVVGVLRALLTADTASFDTSMRKAVVTTQTTTKAIGGLGAEVEKLAPQAARMVKALGGEKLLSTANNLVAAITKIGGATKLSATEQARANATLTQAIAKYTALGQTAPSAMLNLERATRGAAGSADRLNASLAQVRTLAGAFGVSLGLGAVVGFTRTLFAMGDELVRVADQTGLTTEEVQRLQFIATQSGNSLDQLTTAISFLQKSLGATGPEFEKVKKNVEALGINFARFIVLGPFDQMSQLAEAISKLPTPTARARAEFELFGRSGAALGPTLIAQFKALGDAAPVMSDEVVRALDDAGDALDKFGLQLKVWAAESFNTLGRGFDLFIKWNFQFEALLAKWNATAIETAGKIPGVGAALKALGVSADQSRTASQFFTDAANAQQAALDRIPAPARRAAGAMTQFGNDTDTAAKQATSAARALADEFKRQMAVAEATADSIMKIEKEMLDTRRAMESRSADDQERLAQQTAQKQLQIFMELNSSLVSLDAERIRNLLLATSGPEVKSTAFKTGSDLGATINEGLLHSFEDIPHFLTSSLLHSGSFWNGLKALGVQMADAIVEPLIKQFAIKLAGARLASALGGSALLGGTAAAGTVAAEVGGTAAATTAAAGGGAAGGAAAGGAGFGSSLAAFATNPITLAVAGAAIGGALLFHHFHRGNRANDARDKFLAQFASFDTHRDSNNPPGFYGLDALLSKSGKHALFTALVGASNPGAVRTAEAPIVAFMASIGKMVKSYNVGGFIPPGVVQPALLHGPEWVIPQSQMGRGGMTIQNHWYVSTIDAKGIRDFVNSGEFTQQLGTAIDNNKNYLTTRMKRAFG